MASNLSHNHQHGVNGIGTALTVLDICTGAGGEALGLEMAGFNNAAAVEIDARACQTLRLNRPAWNVIESDIRAINGNDYKGVDLLAGGVPCPPFTIAGKQLGSDDERDLFPEATSLIEQVQPKAVMLENVPGFASAKFASYRNDLLRKLYNLHYAVQWRVLNSSRLWRSPTASTFRAGCVARTLHERLPLACAWQSHIYRRSRHWGPDGCLRGWHGVTHWYRKANGIAPTLVGGSKKHGGPDLGPTRARKQWFEFGIDGLGIANAAPDEAFPADGMPRLTLRMAARIQAFPKFVAIRGRQNGRLSPNWQRLSPLVAQAVGESIMAALTG